MLTKLPYQHIDVSLLLQPRHKLAPNEMDVVISNTDHPPTWTLECRTLRMPRLAASQGHRSLLSADGSSLLRPEGLQSRLY
jgi:hypothetical protein